MFLEKHRRLTDVSKLEQAEDLSLDNQMKLCRRKKILALDLKNLVLVLLLTTSSCECSVFFGHIIINSRLKTIMLSSMANVLKQEVKTEI